ncbi:MAG: hypothetical protein IT381_22170 [Deltaproteobacteria bacterium]|nr:hypothetical protein [Deltaproteobacteria bacterium]
MIRAVCALLALALSGCLWTMFESASDNGEPYTGYHADDPMLYVKAGAFGIDEMVIGAIPGETTPVTFWLTRSGIDRAEKSGSVRVKLVIDGRRVALQDVEHGWAWVHRRDYEGDEETVSFVFARDELRALRDAKAAALVVGRDRIDLKAAFEDRIDRYVQRLWRKRRR